MAPASSKFRRALVYAGLALSGAAVLSGCSRDIEHRGYQARAQDLQQLRIGMTKQEVRSTLG
ncbi:MAG: hypothetical protein ACR2OL_08185, partial [Anderseniella sp.]